MAAETRLAYQYESLPEGQWIRLLHLAPGALNEPVKGTLESVRLDQVIGRYRALSYRWGPGPASHLVEIDGKSIPVRHNLYEFLRRLRSDDVLDMPLWTDAICIDQGSATERNHQVELMQNIYRNSCVTVVWLSSNIRQPSASCSPLTTGLKLSDPAPPEFNRRYNARNLNLIISNDYWRRLWIVQEVILSPFVHIYAEWDRLLLGEWSIFLHHCRLGAERAGKRIARKLQNSVMLQLDADRWIAQTQEGNGLRDFPAIFRRFHKSQCSDVRDRVYGIRGLVNDCTIPVDYSKSCSELLASATRAYPEFAKDFALPLLMALDVLRQAGIQAQTQLEPLVRVMVRERGFIELCGRRPTWNEHPHTSVYCYPDLAEGDELYDLCCTGPSLQDVGRFLLVLRKQVDLSVAQHTGIITYDVVTVVSIGELHNASFHRSIETKTFRCTKMRAYRSSPSGMVLEMPIPELIELSYVNGLLPPDHMVTRLVRQPPLPKIDILRYRHSGKRRPLLSLSNNIRRVGRRDNRLGGVKRPMNHRYWRVNP
jgi:hypothetical protein